MNDSDNQNILEILQYLKNTQICKNCAENNDKLVERNILIYKNTQESSSAYNNTVISLCYVSMLVIFSAIYNHLPQNIINAFGENLLISIFFYFINEVHKNHIDKEVNNKLNKTVNQDETKYYEALKNWFIDLNNEYTKFRKFWFIYYITSIVTGVTAAIILFYALFFGRI